MTNNRIVSRLLPDPLASLEQAERFSHRDITSDLNPMRAWAEASLIEHALAELVFHRQRGACLHIVNGEQVYAVDWLNERLSRLRAFLRRKVAA